MTDLDALQTDSALVEEGIRRNIATMESLLEGEHVETLVRAAEMISTSLRRGGKLLAFGNGGSAADAQHIVAEFLGRYLLEREAMPAISLSDNSAAVTAIANDYRYEEIYARQVAGLGVPGDVALAISTSGDSDNVLAAVEVARQRGLRTIGLTGGTGGRLADAVELCMIMPADDTPRIQEGHILMAHLLCELVERQFAADQESGIGQASKHVRA